jgi:hypothetical protein
MCDHLTGDVGDLVAALGVVDYLGHEGVAMTRGYCLPRPTGRPAPGGGGKPA